MSSYRKVVGMPNDTYHDLPSVSASFLKTLIQRSPAHAKWERENREETPAMKRGTLIHTALLEPHLLGELYCTLPEDAPRKVSDETMEAVRWWREWNAEHPLPLDAPKRPTSRQLEAKKPSEDTVKAIAFWQAWDAEHPLPADAPKKPTSEQMECALWWDSWDAHTHGKESVKPEQMEEVDALVQAVKATTFKDAEGEDVPFVLASLEKGIIEPTLLWEQSGVACRARPDIIREDTGLIIDIKTTTDARPFPWANKVMTMGHYLQAALQWMGYEAVYGQPPNAYVWIVVEQSQPHGVCVYTADMALIEHGMKQIRQGLEVYKQCAEADTWPNYDPSPRLVKLPTYLDRNNDESEEPNE